MKFKITYLVFTILTLLVIACQNGSNEQKRSEESQSKYVKKGQEITLQTFSVLGGQLQKAIKQGGVAHAIEYCNLNAFPLVDSLSKVHNASIRRVSFKARNPLDTPNKNESAILRNYEEAFQNKSKLAPVVEKNNDQTISFFAPIMTNAFCLQCHGVIGETLNEEDYFVIKNKYPQDKAVGYVEGDLRGMWSITFNDEL